MREQTLCKLLLLLHIFCLSISIYDTQISIKITIIWNIKKMCVSRKLDHYTTAQIKYLKKKHKSYEYI